MNAHTTLAKEFNVNSINTRVLVSSASVEVHLMVSTHNLCLLASSVRYTSKIYRRCDWIRDSSKQTKMCFRSMNLTVAIAVATAITITSQLVLPTTAHGMLLEPPNRSSIWRFDEFNHLTPIINYDDNANFCGGRPTQMENNGKCGICGDNYNDPIPRANEDGGEYGRGIIVRAYRSGEDIPVAVNLTTNHKGTFLLRLCARDDVDSHLNEACYDEHHLQLADGSGTKYRIPKDSAQAYMVTYNVTLPQGVTCKHCVLQWRYETANNMGKCDDGSEALDCGPQENFYGCSDIAIYPQTDDSFNRNPNSNFDYTTTTTAASETMPEESEDTRMPGNSGSGNATNNFALWFGIGRP